MKSRNGRSFTSRIAYAFEGTRAIWVSVGSAIVAFLLIVLTVGTVFVYATQLRDRDATIEGLRDEVADIRADLLEEERLHQACKTAAEAYRMSALTFSEAMRTYLARPFGPQLDLSKPTEYVDKAQKAGCE